METDIKTIKLERANKKIQILEKMIEDKTREVFYKNQQLESSNQKLTRLYQMMPSALLVFSSDGVILRVNQAMLDTLSYQEDCLTGGSVDAVSLELTDLISEKKISKNVFQIEQLWFTSSDELCPVLVSIFVSEYDDEGKKTFVCVGSSLKERKKLEMELSNAQKLESIGQLAAGIAHEINTPMQFIGDNLHFLKESFGDILTVFDAYQELKKLVPTGEHEKLESLEALEEEADIEYVKERGPTAFDRSLEGISRVTEIVSAMKAFSHPLTEKVPSNINEAIETTLVVCMSEHKYVADVITHLGDIPKVHCQLGEINQVFLNLIVNAAHAIDEKNIDGMGKIEIETFSTDEKVVVRISDNGNGIPLSIQDSIFNPFFTTKVVGKGTGQGLSLAYKIIVDGHSGMLRFESEEGVGTSFFVELPIGINEE